MTNPGDRRPTSPEQPEPLRTTELVEEIGLTADERQLIETLAQRLLDGSAGTWTVRRDKALAVMTALADGDAGEAAAIVDELERLVADWNARNRDGAETIPVPF